VAITPWGTPEELRARKLKPGPGTSREEVDANQRERLVGAMASAVAQHGYAKTRVADVLELSGVSRNAFYKHFHNKRECFLATLDTAAEIVRSAVVDTYFAHDGSWDERLRAAVDVLVERILASPDAARIYYVEAYAAGPEAVATVDRIVDRLEKLTRQAFDESPERAEMPRELVRAIVRAFRHVIEVRLRQGREQELVELAPQLVDWALSYRTPPERLRHPRKPPARFAPPEAGDETTRDRILLAAVELVAEKGYDGLTVTDIASRAAISLTTFYAEFDNKEAVILAALRRSTRRVYSVTAPVYQAAADWQHGVGDALHAFFALLAQEPAFAQFGGVGARLGSPLVVEVRHQLLAGSRAFLAEGYRQNPETSPVAGEAIGAAIDSLLFDHARHAGEHRLYEVAPTAAFLALAPFVGVAEACAIANESR
jgi:AcrR family transcriptional regulator